MLLASLWLVTNIDTAYAQQATAGPTRPPTATPTPSPADAELAARLAREGETERAIGAYLAVVAEGTAGERLDARYSLGRLYLDEGRDAAAERQLNAYLLEAPVDADVRRAQFLLAEALAAQADWSNALPLYDAYIQGGGPAAIYARLGHAQALAGLGRIDEAADDADLLMQLDLPQSQRLAFMLSMAQAVEPEQPEQALAWYRGLENLSDAPEDQALAIWRQAQIDGDTMQAWQKIMREYPETSTAQDIVDQPPPIKCIGTEPGDCALVDSYYTGLVYYRGGRYPDARAAFQASIERNETADGDRSLAARSAYYLAVIDEAHGSKEQAISGYRHVVELDPGIDLAADALWWRGRLLEQRGRIDEARDDYKQLVADYGSSDWGADARFRLGLLDYDAGLYSQAAQTFASIAGDSKDAEQQRALLWQGKSLAAFGDEDGATTAWTSLRDDDPLGYYGLRAAVLQQDPTDDLEDAGIATEGTPDWPAIQSWLRSIGQNNPDPVLSGLVFNPHWALAQELLALGMERRAGAEYELLLAAARRNPTSLYHVARYAHDAGLTSVSSRAATRLLSNVSEEDASAAPPGLWRLAYPAPFTSMMRDVSDDEDVPDVLLLAVIRQESFFDPLAGSTAGALGLAQVIPVTGEAIAQDLGVDDFSVEDLYRPSVSLRFGAHYLSEQLDAFDGDVYAALAAYNGGPGNAAKWSDASGGDPDRFLEEVEFDQTKAYLRLVSENLARYRQLYQGLPEPALPAD